MKIIGVDPGVNRLGYGLVESGGGRETVISSGVITPPVKDAYCKKIAVIAEKIDGLLDSLNPDMLVMEEIYLGRNFKVALKIGQVMGIVLGAAGRKNIPFRLLSPREIKQNITGKGGAAKEQVRYMVEIITGYKDFGSEDESDAVAAAVAYLNYKKEYDLLHSG